MRELAKNIGINQLNLSNYDDEFVSLKQYIKAMETAKKKKLYHHGDEEFLVSKIPINGKGFIESDLKIDSRVFYTFKSEHIIEMARVSKPGIYLIANIPYEEYVNAAYYILFVTDGDAFLVDNNIHAFREFLSRSDERLMQRRTSDTFLPWEIISDFLDKKSDDKTLTDVDSNFSFRVIGNLSTVNHTDIFGLTAFLDTCLYTFTKTDFLKEVSVALKISMLNTIPLTKQDNSLAIYKQNIPSISSMDLSWKPEKLDLPQENSGSYLVPFLKELPVEKIDLNIIRDDLTSFEQVEKNLMYQSRKQSAEILQGEIKKDYDRNWEKVKEQLTLFIQKKFAEKRDYYIKKILEDREYQYKRYQGFGTYEEEKFQKENVIIEKEKILSIHCDHKIIHGKGNIYYASSERNFHFTTFEYRGKYFPCASCNKNGKTEYILTIKDVQVFIDFFELSEKEIKDLPKQMKKYLNQARTLYDGNSILEDLDPVSLIENPWWVCKNSNHNSSPQITMSMALCKFCSKRKLRRIIYDKS